MTSPVFELADKYVTKLAELDPLFSLGLGNPVGGLTDFSPAGAEQSARLARETLAELDTIADQSEFDRVARLSMQERLGAALAAYDAGDHLADLNILFCPVSEIRQAFDLLPLGEPGQEVPWLKTLEAIPSALAGWRESLESGMKRGITAARRQALEVSEQCARYALGDFLAGPVEQIGRGAAEMELAKDAFAEMGSWLRDVYAPACQVNDGVGIDRYRRAIRRWNGIDVDPIELFNWGWDELDRITTRMKRVVEQVKPGAQPSELGDLLDESGKYRIEGEAEIVAFLRQLTDSATTDMLEHFEIPEQVRHCDVKIAPAGSASAAYYLPPSEDFSRPGSTWLPNVSEGIFQTWHLVSTWYHEAVPGHHLQIAAAMTNAENLSRFQRTVGWISGYGEGWALYAERLMDELGYFDEPGIEAGFLSAQGLRASRIIVDIGMHLGLSVPEGREGEVAGTPIDYDFSVDFLQRRALLPAVEAQSETVRYLGIPAQAISYKLGEKTILELREAAKVKAGEGFDLKAWHSWFLGIGPVGLATLQELA